MQLKTPSTCNEVDYIGTYILLDDTSSKTNRLVIHLAGCVQFLLQPFPHVSILSVFLRKSKPCTHNHT